MAGVVISVPDYCTPNAAAKLLSAAEEAGLPKEVHLVPIAEAAIMGSFNWRHLSATVQGKVTSGLWLRSLRPMTDTALGRKYHCISQHWR